MNAKLVTDRGTSTNTPEFAEHLLRELAPQVLGVVARKCGDFADAEDAVQEALIAAATQWRAAGVPTNPRGWLYSVAMRRLNDRVRSESARRRRENEAASEHAHEQPFVSPPDAELGVMTDDTLVLLFMCCHSALSPSSAIALTLRAVGGLTTAEIASAFLVPEATMAQRISRAKQSIKSSGVAFRMPTDDDLAERLGAVMHVLYLIFNEGYASSSGPDLHRVDLSAEAIRLTRMLRALTPDNGEVAGLLALMLLTDARRAARSGCHGELIPLDAQDRSLWDRQMISEGTALVSSAFASGSVGPYLLQAAIAALHDESPRVQDTDWPQIMALYGVLKRMSDNPMVALNHAIAVAMVDGAEAGLALVSELDTDQKLRGHYRLDAVRAHLYEMIGDDARAVLLYRAAAEGTASIPERDYLNLKAARASERS
ncbi:MAG TPA: sigma-70 family RNA polymerase sigma factor [Gemmatimonadaceae bacterium]|nr:sigma-70 family RNA polymerase sigma factor [Gemmatimonadaceae bacterium]